MQILSLLKLNLSKVRVGRSSDVSLNRRAYFIKSTNILIKRIRIGIPSDQNTFDKAVDYVTEETHYKEFIDYKMKLVRTAGENMRLTICDTANI